MMLSSTPALPLPGPPIPSPTAVDTPRPPIEQQDASVLDAVLDASVLDAFLLVELPGATRRHRQLRPTQADDDATSCFTCVSPVPRIGRLVHVAAPVTFGCAGNDHEAERARRTPPVSFGSAVTAFAADDHEAERTRSGSHQHLVVTVSPPLDPPPSPPTSCMAEKAAASAGGVSFGSPVTKIFVGSDEDAHRTRTGSHRHIEFTATARRPPRPDSGVRFGAPVTDISADSDGDAMRTRSGSHRHLVIAPVYAAPAGPVAKPAV
jgi:hypothetical protein